VTVALISTKWKQNARMEAFGRIICYGRVILWQNPKLKEDEL
jgi:hypothetical protein